MLLRIGAGALLGGCIGYERTDRGRPLGLRTHVLVSLAAATFMIISIQLPFYQAYGDVGGKLVQVDTSRIASMVVSAVGFLAGGSIMRSGTHVQGLTTAAALWLATALGMCAGAGMYVEAVFATALGLFTLRVVRRLEDKREFPIRGEAKLKERERLTDLCQLLERNDMVIVAVEDHVPDSVTVRFELKRAATRTLAQIVHEIETLPAVEQVSVERMA
jgi:putative Mg2+ transporter-C (MgtC) family protein